MARRRNNLSTEYTVLNEPAPERADGETDFAIRRQSLHDSVVDHVRAMIICGDLVAGEKVPTQALAQSLGVSTTPLREALKVLAEEQLVELLPSRGARVIPFTAEEAVVLFEVIASLESLAAELAATRITQQSLTTLEQLHAQMRLHFEAKEKAPYFALNSRIHDGILKAAANPVLVLAHARLHVRAARGRYMARSNRRGIRATISDRTSTRRRASLKVRAKARFPQRSALLPSGATRN
jgi:DNA-binding GntR family transcriptional regulator